MSDAKLKPVVGIVGSIGAGKSMVAAALAKRGGVVIDADRVGHSVLDRPTVREKLAERWGKKVLNADGRVNRRAVAEIVFADEQERQALEAIVFPAIEKSCRKLIASAQEDKAAEFIVLDAAVLLEAKWTGVTDKILCVTAGRDIRWQRVKRRGWSREELVAREAAQWPIKDKKLLADAVVRNDGKPEKLQKAVDEVLAHWEWGRWRK